ncbi:MAG: hypothetical protein PHI85_01785 [Victivallaceae bacterium]|nr:hypothetical protein [Victivallaceae bacterium]
MILNIFNGDCAAAAWRRNPTPGDCLVWRENYLVGAPPDVVSGTPRYIAARAAALAGVAADGAADKCCEEIAADLENMERRLAGAGAGDTLVLWFDVCPFDRAMLTALLWRLDSRPPSTRPHAVLVCRDIDWGGRTDDFIRFLGTAVELQPDDFSDGAAMWRVWSEERRRNPAAAPDMPACMRRVASTST